jgi:hypothetical protein
METQSTVNMVLSSGLVIFGWFARELWTAVKELKSDLAQVREDLPKLYVGQEHYREDIRELKAMMDKIDHRLDTKFGKWGGELEGSR